MQKPPKQILAVGVGEKTIKWLFVSEHEANSIRKHLRKLYRENDARAKRVWFVQPNGSHLLKGKSNEEFPLFDDTVERGFLEINALMGNAAYFDHHVEELENWLAKEADLKIRFMKMRTARDPEQNRILRGCKSILDNDVVNMNSRPKQMFRARAVRDKNREGKLRVERDEMKGLPLRKVRYLHPQSVKLLGMDCSPDEREPLFEALTPTQIPHLVAEQMKWLPLSKVVYLDKPEQISGLSLEQVKMLREHQAHLIPHINPEYAPIFSEKWQIENVAPHHVPFLNGVQIKWISLDKVEFLVNQDQISHLSLEQSKMMKEHQADLIPHLNPDFYRTFTQRWQVDRIPFEHIDKIDSRWIPFLTIPSH